MNVHSKPININDHDVLSGRGVTISRHPGNERLRNLLKNVRHNEHCKSYTLEEKRAAVKDAMAHIRHLDPPGRFLKLESNSSYGGKWWVLSESEALKQILQALQDYNRKDRSGCVVTKVISPSGVVTKGTKVSRTEHRKPMEAFPYSAIMMHSDKNKLNTDNTLPRKRKKVEMTTKCNLLLFAF